MQTSIAPPATRLLDDLRALPRAFWVLFAGTFINRFGSFVWPFLAIYLTRQGYSVTVAAFAVSSVGLGNFLGSGLGGWLADHFGRRHTIAAGSAASGAFVMLLFYAESLPAIFACTILLGVASGSYHPAASALLADVVPPELRVRAYAAIRLAINAGFACGAALGGILANYSFFWLFAGDALTTFLFSFLALVALPHGLRGQTQQAPWSLAIRQLRDDRAFHALFASSFCAALVFAQFGSTYSLFITQAQISWSVLGWRIPPEALYGLLLGWNGVMIVCFELPLTGWTRAFNPRRTMALGYLLLGVGFAINGLSFAIPLLVLSMTIFSIGEMISIPVSSAYTAQLAPEAMRGRYMGALALSWTGASILGPLIGFHLLEVAPALLWIGCAGLGVISAVILLKCGRTPAAEGAALPIKAAA